MNGTDHVDGRLDLGDLDAEFGCDALIDIHRGAILGECRYRT
jgi:hypothetical protein